MKSLEIIFVGQAPGPAGGCAGEGEMEPLSGRCGERLAGLMDMRVEHFLNSFTRKNLNLEFQGKVGKGDAFDEVEGIRVAKFLRGGPHKKYVMCGHQVQRCFGYSFLPPLFCCVELVPKKAFFALPHPSGINLWWNSKQNQADAKLALARFIKL